MAMTHLHNFCCGSVEHCHCERLTPLSLSAASVVSQTSLQYPNQSSNINISDTVDLLTLGNRSHLLEALTSVKKKITESPIWEQV